MNRVVQLERGKTVTAIPSTTAVTTTTRAYTANGNNAIIIYSDITGTGTWNVKLQGASTFNGTYMDVYDHNYEPMQTGNITESRAKIFVGIPQNFKIVSTEAVDGATIQVDYELFSV